MLALDIVAKEHRYLAMLEAPPLEQSRSWVTPHIQRGHPFFVAVVGSQVIGWCDITPLDRAAFSHRGQLGLGVHPDFRRRGIGTRLLHAAVSHARKIGVERVELEVFASNRVAKQIYERYGFSVEGILRRACKFDGHYDDVFVMTLFLN